MKKCEPGFDNVSMFSFSNAIVLRSMRGRSEVIDAMGDEILL